MRPVLAELLGTFALTLAVSFALANPGSAVPAPVTVAVTLAVLVYVLGPVSGCFINPAVTVAVASVGELPARETAWFVLAQFAGAALALGAVRLLPGAPVALPVDGSVATGMAEMLGAAFLAFAIVPVLAGHVPGQLSGVVIAMGLLVGISWSAPHSNAVLNPAVALGIGSMSLPYVWGPLAGAILGAQVARYVCGPRRSSD